MIKKVITVILVFMIGSFLFANEEIMDVSLLMVHAESRIGEDITFLEKRVPEILKNILVRYKPEQFRYLLSWQQSDQYDDWKAKSELSATENGRLLDADFVIYGSVIQKIEGYAVQLQILNVHTGRLVTSFDRESAGKEDLYSFLESISVDLHTRIEKEVTGYLETRVTFKKIAGVEAVLGYPVPVADYLNVQIGAVTIGGAFNITYGKMINKHLKISVRAGAILGWHFLFYHPSKIEGYFNDIVLSFPVSAVFTINNTVSLITGISFGNWFSIYSQVGFDKNVYVFFTYGPAAGVHFNFEVPLPFDKRFNLGMKNEFDFIFYSGTHPGTINPKFQYRAGFYFLYKFGA